MSPGRRIVCRIYGSWGRLRPHVDVAVIGIHPRTNTGLASTEPSKACVFSLNTDHQPKHWPRREAAPRIREVSATGCMPSARFSVTDRKTTPKPSPQECARCPRWYAARLNHGSIPPPRIARDAPRGRQRTMNISNGWKARLFFAACRWPAPCCPARRRLRSAGDQILRRGHPGAKVVPGQRVYARG
jgi:hypothetical protein